MFKKGQHPHLGAIDDFFLFQKKRVRAGTSRVHHGGHARLQRDVRRDPVRRQVGTAFGGEPVERRAAMADVDVNIDEPGGDVEPGGVHHLSRLAGGNVFFDGGDFVFHHRHVHDCVHVVRGINHMAALQQQVITGRLGESVGRHTENCNERYYDSESLSPFPHVGAFLAFPLRPPCPLWSTSMNHGGHRGTEVRILFARPQPQSVLTFLCVLCSSVVNPSMKPRRTRRSGKNSLTRL